MRRLVGWLAVLGLVTSLAGCYKGRGICDCLDYRDPCCYGCYGCDDGHCDGAAMHAPPHPMHAMPPLKAEPLKVMPKEIDEAKPKPPEVSPAPPEIK